MTTNIAFLDTLVTREPDGKLHTSVYRKPTHTDQYLAYDSHHPQSVKRGIVKCLHDRAKRIITKPSGTAQEKKHLSTVLVANGYPSPLLQKVTETRNPALFPFSSWWAGHLRGKLKRSLTSSRVNHREIALYSSFFKLVKDIREKSMENNGDEIAVLFPEGHEAIQITY